MVSVWTMANDVLRMAEYGVRGRVLSIIGTLEALGCFWCLCRHSEPHRSRISSMLKLKSKEKREYYEYNYLFPHKPTRGSTEIRYPVPRSWVIRIPPLMISRGSDDVSFEAIGLEKLTVKGISACNGCTCGRSTKYGVTIGLDLKIHTFSCAKDHIKESSGVRCTTNLCLFSTCLRAHYRRKR